MQRLRGSGLIKEHTPSNGTFPLNGTAAATVMIEIKVSFIFSEPARARFQRDPLNGPNLIWKHRVNHVLRLLLSGL